MPGENLIEPLAGSQPVEITPTAPTPEDAPESPGAELSDEVLKLDAMGPLFAGSPPAMSLKIKDMAKTEDGKIIAKNAAALQSANIFFYRALDKETGIIANGQYISPDAIKQADEQGQLASVAPDWNLVAGEASRAGQANPVMTSTGVPEAPPAPAAPLPPQQSSGLLNPPPASAQTKLAGARSRNLQEGSPTSGRAAQGRLLNNLLKPAI